MKHFNSMASGSFTQFLPDDPAKPAPTDLFMIGHLLPRTLLFLTGKMLDQLSRFWPKCQTGHYFIFTFRTFGCGRYRNFDPFRQAIWFFNQFGVDILNGAYFKPFYRTNSPIWKDLDML
jgi:hypothetical protein